MLPSPRHPIVGRLRRSGVLLGLLVLAFATSIAIHRPLLVGIASWFRVDDPAPSDALVLLLGGASHRPARVAVLFAERLAPRVLMAQSRAEGDIEWSETDLSRKILIRRGVSSGAIAILPGNGTSTREEAQLVRDYARAHRWRRITVVTTAFHTSRARWIFRKVLRGTGIEVRMAAAEHPAFNERDWFTRDEGLAMYFSELLKTIYYRLVY